MAHYKALALLAGGLCIAAGAYLLQTQSLGGGEAGGSWLEVIAHGMGIYFVGKGLFVGAVMWRWAEQAEVARDQLDALVGIAEKPTYVVRERVPE